MAYLFIYRVVLGHTRPLIDAIDDYVEEVTGDRTALHAKSSSIGPAKPGPPAQAGEPAADTASAVVHASGARSRRNDMIVAEPGVSRCAKSLSPSCFP